MSFLSNWLHRSKGASTVAFLPTLHGVTISSVIPKKQAPYTLLKIRDQRVITACVSTEHKIEVRSYQSFYKDQNYLRLLPSRFGFAKPRIYSQCVHIRLPALQNPIEDADVRYSLLNFDGDASLVIKLPNNSVLEAEHVIKDSDLDVYRENTF